MSSLPKVLVRNKDLPSGGFQLLEKSCELFKLTSETTSAGIANFLTKINGVDAILWSGHTGPSKEVLDAAGPKLKIIASTSAGVDHFDVTAIKARNIQISNTPNVLNNAVAEIAVLLCLGAGRRLEEGRRAIVQNEWNPDFQWMLGHGLSGATVGIVGLGGLGTAIAKRLRAFEICRLLYTGRNRKPAGDVLQAEFVPFNTLLVESDFVISAIPLTPETKEIFNSNAFGQMKSTAVFVNVGRGGLVDQDALISALKSNKIFAAGLDVMTPEPLPCNHELTKLPNCVLIPHLGSATIETRNEMTILAAKNILAALEGRELLTPV